MINDMPHMLENVALHYFGSINNIVTLSGVTLPGIGSVDYLLIRHKILKAEVEDFVMIKLQSASASSSEDLERDGLNFFESYDLQTLSRSFDLETKDKLIQRLNARLQSEILSSVRSRCRTLDRRRLT